jgi:membrane associated rhomboid family serine protease
VVTVVLIFINALFFVVELMLGPNLGPLLLEYGVVPARYTVPDISRLFSFPEQVLALVTSMFLHGGWVHLLGNMWTLWIFGDNVEDRLGRGRYLTLYLAGGFAAAWLHILTNPVSLVPTIGASGAIAAVMGAYFRFFPTARIEALIPPFFLGPFFVFPAVVFLGWWFLLQFFNGALSLGASSRGFSGVAWWAHVGGFLFGLIVCLGARRVPPRIRDFY